MIYLVFYGQTQALRCRKILAENGIIGHLGKMPRRQKMDACAWVVSIGWEERKKACQILKLHGMQPDACMDAQGRTI